MATVELIITSDRLPSPSLNENDTLVTAVTRHNPVLKQDAYTCSGCGFEVTPHSEAAHTLRDDANGNDETREQSVFFKMHHLDGNTKNNAPANLTVLCPLCYNVVHCGTVKDAASVVLCPWLSQAQINLTANLSLCAIASGAEWAGAAAEFLDGLELLERIADEEYAQGISNAAQLGAALTGFRARMPSEWDRRGFALAGIRLMPSVTAYEEAARFWAGHAWPQESEWGDIYKKWMMLHQPASWPV